MLLKRTAIVFLTIGLLVYAAAAQAELTVVVGGNGGGGNTGGAGSTPAPKPMRFSSVPKRLPSASPMHCVAISTLTMSPPSSIGRRTSRC